MLFEFIVTNRDEIIRRCRAKVAARAMPLPTAAEIDYGVPVFLDQLLDTLHGRTSASDIRKTALQHGHELLLRGFTVSQVVHDYSDVCQAITELALEKDAPITAEDLRTLNRCLDDAIASAVTEYGRGRNQSAVDQGDARERERLGFFAHELRNLINTSIMAFEVLRTGNVGVGGSTGTVLRRSLQRTAALIERSLAEVRLTEAVQNQEPFRVAGFIEDVRSAAAVEAAAKQLTLTVAPVDAAVMIEADRLVLAAVVGNLLQNAFKFTRPNTTVALRVATSAERVLIEIQDECGGLPHGNVDDLFRPFKQPGADRTGLGLGLAFSRWGTEANHGRLYARNLPHEGCVFTVDLPRCQRELTANRGARR